MSLYFYKNYRTQERMNGRYYAYTVILFLSLLTFQFYQVYRHVRVAYDDCLAYKGRLATFRAQCHLLMDTNVSFLTHTMSEFQFNPLYLILFLLPLWDLVLAMRKRWLIWRENCVVRQLRPLRNRRAS